MPTKRIGDLPGSAHCRHREHNPPAHICLPDGVYEHECPSCHTKQVFTVVTSMLVSDGKGHLFPAEDSDP